MQENYLAKWLSGDLSEEDLAEFKKSDSYASYQRLKQVSDTLQAPDYNTDTVLEQLKKERIENTPKIVALNPYRNFLRVAAAIAILLVGSYFYFNSFNTSITTEVAERGEVLLPDNSEIFLNADSKISYSKKDWNQKRNVSLEGEAFFKVAKGKKFTVSTDQGTIAVLGTQFNVENRDGFFEVTCYEGLVRVIHNNKENMLPAGNTFLVINHKIVDAGQPNSTKPSWMNNESSFEATPLSFVFAELERQYKIDISLKNVDEKLLFTGSFSNTDLNTALKSISTPSRIKYKIEGDNVLFYAENMP
ncbi:hypothetical protein HME9304_00761 [Flagellimonas maritima]|uniref:FecR family protein n=1 Tax=Flagellimonas maritima TaxID=1383885 RepID=A0A2Z4LPU3_9FLAO|nr:FecR family protein [Allomuricauda aurantiaca]AWX43770.1 hypothetical protein HME9304_00761 [Allomuricauda aurantiaca]